MRYRTSRSAAFFVAAFLLAGACSGGDDAQTPASPGVGEEAPATVVPAIETPSEQPDPDGSSDDAAPPATEPAETALGDPLDTYSRLQLLEDEFGEGSPEVVTQQLALAFGPLATTDGFGRDGSTYPTLTHTLENYAEVRDELDPSDVAVADERIAELIGPDHLIAAFDLEGNLIQATDSESSSAGTEPEGLRRSPDDDAVDDPDDDFIDGPLQERWATLGNSVWAELAPRLPSVTLDAVVIVTEPSFWVGRGDADDPDAEAGGGNVTRGLISLDPTLRPLQERYGSHDCYILIASDRNGSGAITTAVLAHELFHCWHYTYLGSNFRQYRNAPEWVLEGLAGWVGETVSGGTRYTGEWYPHFAVQTFDLFSTNYPAIGFWQQVHEGTDLWSAIPAIVTSGTSASNEVSFDAAIGAIPATAAFVASGILQRGDLGPEWTMAGGPAGVSRTPEAIDVDPDNPASPSVRAGEQAAYEFTVTPGADADRAGSLISITGRGYLAGQWSDDQRFAAFDETIDLQYCLGDCGACPTIGPDGVGTPLPPSGATLVLALAGTGGGPGGFAVSVVDCDEEEPPGDPGIPGTGFVGRWRANPDSVRQMFLEASALDDGSGDEPVVALDIAGVAGDVFLDLFENGTGQLTYDTTLFLNDAVLVDLTLTGGGSFTWDVESSAMTITNTDFEISGGSSAIGDNILTITDEDVGSPGGTTTLTVGFAGGNELTLINANGSRGEVFFPRLWIRQ
jgi:hypothetical protein